MKKVSVNLEPIFWIVPIVQFSPLAAAKHAAFVKARGRHYSNEAEAMKVTCPLSLSSWGDSKPIVLAGTSAYGGRRRDFQPREGFGRCVDGRAPDTYQAQWRKTRCLKP